MMYGSTKMRLLLGLAGLVIFLNFADVGAFSAPCPPGACGDSPVVVTFNSWNCAGRKRFVPLDVSWFQCKSLSGSESQIDVFNDNYIESSTYRDSHCGSGIEFPDFHGQRSYYGNCVNWVWDFASDRFPTSIHRILPKFIKRGEGFSYMYLKSKSQPFQAPQNPVVDPNMPNKFPVNIQCYSPGDCAAKGLYWTENFHQPGCSKVDSYSAVNVTANTCYREGQLYQTYHCVNQHTVETRVSQNSDCSRPVVSDIFGGLCGRTQTSIFCNNSTAV